MSSASKYVVLSGGGLTGTIAVYFAKENFDADVHVLSLDYGQPRCGLVMARKSAEAVGGEHHVAKLGAPAYGALKKYPSFVPDFVAGVPPNLMMTLLSLGYALAADVGATAVMVGSCAPVKVKRPADASVAFFDAYEKAQKAAIEKHRRGYLRLRTPFRSVSRAKLIGFGTNLGVDFTRTFTCERHSDRGRPLSSSDFPQTCYRCGVCEPCIERQAAFKIADAVDPLVNSEASPGRSQESLEGSA